VHSGSVDTAPMPDLTGDWVGLAALAVFAAPYALVIGEEANNLRKSKPMVVAAGILWLMQLGATGANILVSVGSRSSTTFR